MIYRFFTLLAVIACGLQPAYGQADNAAYFGVRHSIEDISMSPDGAQVAFIQAATGQNSVLFVASSDGGEPKPILKSDAAPWRLSWCNWVSNTRLVCQLYGLPNVATFGELFTARLIAINSDGSLIKQLGQKSFRGTYGLSQDDGDIIGWPADDNGQVVMSRAYLEEEQSNTRLANKEVGLGVDLVDTATLRTRKIEAPRGDASGFIVDNEGNVRIIQTRSVDGQGMLSGVFRFSYRMPGSRDWKKLSVVTADEKGLVPVAVDSKENVAYAFRDKEGRRAVYKVKLDETAEETLVFAHDKVDVDGLLRFGRSGRVIGARYNTDKPEMIIFEESYRNLAGKLGKALPGLPIVRFVDASRDENRLLLFAGSDTDPGRYYVYDQKAKRLNEIALVRPELEGKLLSPVKPVSYPAADGTAIPGYLTLPPGGAGKNMPAIVMPHGGPSSRDEWGFDWLAQYFAAQGYAVLQPNFRGSAGYGDDWYADNGFKSWRLAVGDVNDAGKWLVDEGLADPSKLAVVGWSYGGYAALQSGVLDPKLFTAVVAIAPVVDLKMLIDQSSRYTNHKLVADFVGSGEHLLSGSPLLNAGKLQAPVLMFSGDKDLNVDISHARAMDQALRKNGKPVELITYTGLDHQLNDSAARIDMLRKSSGFLKKHLKLP